MNSKRKAIRITAIVHRDLTDLVISALKRNKIHYFYMEPGRYPVLAKRGWLLFDFYQNHSIIDTPVTIFEVACEPIAENFLLTLFRDAAELNVPGHGSVYSETIDLHSSVPTDYIFTIEEKNKSHWIFRAHWSFLYPSARISRTHRSFDFTKRSCRSYH